MQTVSWTRKSAKCFTRNVENKGWGKGGANGRNWMVPLCAEWRVRPGAGIRLCNIFNTLDLGLGTRNSALVTPIATHTSERALSLLCETLEGPLIVFILLELLPLET